MANLFLYRLKDSDDRDCCAYIYANPSRFECNHYFGGITIFGSCYHGGKFADYDEIETVLSREEYQTLLDFSEALGQLGYGIVRGDERYQKGIQLCADIQPVFDKLQSKEAEEFFDKIWESEKEFLMEEYSLDEDDIEDIIDNYYSDYRDRSIISCVFQDVYECGYEEAFNMGYLDTEPRIKHILERYFDFEQFGEDLLEDERYHKLNDGRVIFFSC